MIERVMGRAIEDVREWTTDKLQQRMSEVVTEDPKDPEQDMISMVYSAVLQGDMLTKEQARWLRDFLEKSMNDKVEAIYDVRSGLDLSDMDELSIYADAWGLYCRPGTYSI